MSESLHERLGEVVNNDPGITMANLLQQVEGATNGDIFGLIASRKLYVDLEAAFLGEPDRVQVFRSKAAATFCHRLSELSSQNRESNIRAADLLLGSTVIWNNNHFKVLQTSKTKIYLRSPDGVTEHYRNEDIERFISEGLITGCQTFSRVVPAAAQLELEAKRSATDEEMVAALERELIVLRILEGEKVAKDGNEARKYRNWRSWYKEKGLAGLVFHPDKKGNRNPKLDQRVSELMLTHIKGTEKPGRGTLSLAYGAFSNACKESEYKPCSFKTFRLAFKARKGPEQTAQIEGSRAAYQEEEPVDNEHYTFPVNGDRPWQFVHIDHTQIDLELRHSTKRRKKMGKAWITLMIDAYSRRILACYLSFDSPSRISVMMVLRECVRRLGRLPECIVVDNGSEFKSAYFGKVLARNGCDTQWRPPTKPRFGAIIERFIKTMNDQFIHTLEGNTKIMAIKTRLVTKEVNPKNLALWNLQLLEEEAEKFFYEEYDTRDHSTLGQSPRDAFEDALEQYNPPFKEINYDENFIIDILPTTRKETAKASRGRGVKIEYVSYTSRVLKAAGLYGQQLKVRYDPWNRAIAYSYINGRWETLYGPPDLYNKLKNRSHKELKVLSEEIRQEKRLYGKNFNARVMEMAEKHASRERLQKIEKQRLRDEEKREAAQRMGRPLSVEDIGSEPRQKQLQIDRLPVQPSPPPTSTAGLKQFGNLRRRTA